MTVENVPEPRVDLEGGGTYDSGFSAELARLVGWENMGRADVAGVMTPVGRP